MEINLLRLTISEQDLNDLARRHLPADHPVEDMKIQVVPEGVHIKGEYPLFINVSFETRWELGIQGGKLTARLANFRALGIPGNIFKSAILKLMADAAQEQDWLALEQDTIHVNVEGLLLKSGLSARTNFSTVTCQAGHIILEAGSQTG